VPSTEQEEQVVKPQQAVSGKKPIGVQIPGMGMGGFNPADIKNKLRKSEDRIPTQKQPLVNSPLKSTGVGPPPVRLPQRVDGVLQPPNNRPPLKHTASAPALPNQTKENEVKQKSPITGKEALFQWCKDTTAGYEGVNITNFTTSWKDGLAFCAIVHHYRPSMINFKSLKKDNPRENLKLAFDAAEKIGIVPLLDPEDVDIPIPEMRSTMTYLSTMFKFFKANG